MPRPLVPNTELDLVGLDREMLLARLRWNASQAIQDWVDYSLAAPENVLLESEAVIGATAFALVNERARQLSLATVTDRPMMIKKARQFGLSLSSATAASVSGTFSMPGGTVTPKTIVVAAGTRMQSGQSLYQTQAAATIVVGGSTSSPVTAENSEVQQNTFAASGFANQVLSLNEYPIIEDSITITAANGTYSIVRADNGLRYKSFLEMDGGTYGALVHTDNDGRGYITFGNGIYGVIPQGNIEVTFKTGGGKSGAVSAAAKWIILDPTYNVDGEQVVLLFNNTLASTGGLDQMTVEEARMRIPMQARTLERTVNEDDVEIEAERITGVARAALMTSNDSSNIPEDEGYLFLVALGSQYSDSLYYPPAAPTTTQISEVGVRVGRGGAAPTVMGLRILVSAATFKTVNVSVQVYKAAGKTGAQVRTAVVQALQKFFAVADENRAPLFQADWGFKCTDAAGVKTYELAWSDLFEVIAGCAEVRKIPATNANLLLNTVRDSIFLDPEEFPILGSVTIYDMDNGGAAI